MRHTIIYSRGTDMLGSGLILNWKMLSRSSISMMAKVELVPRLLVQPPVLSRIFTRFLYVCDQY